jgi:hypothetical protein
MRRAEQLRQDTDALTAALNAVCAEVDTALAPALASAVRRGTYHLAEEGGRPVQESLSGQRFRGVEIIDAHGNPLGEFDEIAAGTFIEEKSALGVAYMHPRTGRPVQTSAQWAEKHIFQKTVVRIDNLQRAAATRPAPGGSPSVPTLQAMLGIRTFQFKIMATAPEIQHAVQAQVTRLRARFPAWEFSVIFGP